MRGLTVVTFNFLPKSPGALEKKALEMKAKTWDTLFWGAGEHHSDLLLGFGLLGVFIWLDTVLCLLLFKHALYELGN